MKEKTENYREYKDMLGWLTCVCDVINEYAPKSDTKTLFRARDIALRDERDTALKILTRELFKRLEPGDTVYTAPFDDPPAVKGPHEATVQEWMPSGKAVRLKDKCGIWSWQYLFIPEPLK